MRRYAAYCGLYCGACMGMILTERAEGDQTTGHLEDVDNDSSCPGCDSPGMAECEFIQCNKEHGTESCAFCPELPCSKLILFMDEYEHHKGVLDNLKRIKEIGMENWVTEQKKYWSCHTCGSRTQWYQKVCTSCNTPL